MSLSRRFPSATALICFTAITQPAWSQGLDISSMTPEQRSAALDMLQNTNGRSGGQPLGARQGQAPLGIKPLTPPQSQQGAIRQSASNRAVQEAAPGFSHQSGLRPFGESLFNVGSSNFTPPSDMPVPADYVIGVGDVVELRLFGKENKLYQLPVERNGVVTLPDIGSIAVAGMSFETMGKTLLERIANQKIGVEATVSMGPLRSMQIFLMGDVNKPGSYTVDGLTTVLNSLLIGGGIKPTGSMRRIEIRRQGKVVSHYDLYDAMLAGSSKQDIRLQSGDTIFVPAVGQRVGISGDVLRPAIYELLAEKSAEDVIRLAGGLLPTAYPGNAKVDRIDTGGKRRTLDISLATPSQRKIELLNGDILNIPSVVTRWETSVTLSGAFERPGNYEWKEGMHLGMLVNSFSILNKDAYRSFAIIKRTDEATGQRNLIPVNLLGVIRGQQTQPLQPEDEVIVLSQADVDFLSSADVQSVLAGRLPPATKRQLGTGSILQSTGLTAEPGNSVDPEIFDTTGESPLPQPQQQFRSQSQQQPQQQSQQQPQQQPQSQTRLSSTPQEYCKGLVEISDIVHREGANRFRSAVLFSGTNDSQPSLVKTQKCPELFDNNPTLLTFALESAITVRGEVKQPGVLPIAAGMPLDAAINARGGLTREADPKGIELSRLSMTVTGKAALNRQLLGQKDQLGQIALEPGNIVVVRKRFSEQESGLIRLSGEVAHPGTYEIRRGEKLSEVISRAGGLTPTAYPYGTIFTRQSIKEEKKQYYQKAAQELQNATIFSVSRQRVTPTAEASATALIKDLMNQLKTIEPSGRMVIEADPTVLQVRPELDAMLEAGDEIFIPRRPSTIMVMGEVLNPGAVQFQSGKTADDYVRAVGGFTRLADQDRIYAILPNGSAEPLKLSSWNFRPMLLPPGSVIYVSREAIPTTNTDTLMLSLQVVKDLALSAASLAVIGK